MRGELPVAFVQLKPQAKVDAAELIAFVAERTPERAAVPVEIFFVEAIPLTAVGKVFKPALRWDATRSVVSRMLADLQSQAVAIAVEVGAHASHGSLVAIRISGAPAAAQAALAAQIHERLNPLVVRHEIAWC